MTMRGNAWSFHAYLRVPDPLLVTRAGEIIDGRLRAKTARELGLAELPVVVCDDGRPSRSGHSGFCEPVCELGRMGMDRVAQELSELQQQNYDPRLTGFDAREISDLLRPREPLDRDKDAVHAGDQKPW